jgi:hypothetical protein
MSEGVTGATPEEVAENRFFQGLYSRWLQARSVDQRSDHDDEGLRLPAPGSTSSTTPRANYWLGQPYTRGRSG